MKPNKSIKMFLSSIFSFLMLMSFPVSAQEEYDDMYFTPRDRKEVKKEPVSFSAERQEMQSNSRPETINPAYESKAYGDVEENYSAKNVNPEYIERYKTNPKENAPENESEEAYYVENFDRENFATDTLEQNNNRYNNRYPNSWYGMNDPWARHNYWGRSFYDPFWDPWMSPGWNMGMGYNFGYMPGMSLTLSYGSGWGYNPWRMRPWYGRPFYGSMAYDPWFYDPWGYDPWMGFGSPYRSSFYHGYYSGFNRGFYTGYYGGGYVISRPDEVNYRYSRRVARGNSNIARFDQDVPNRRTAITQRPSTNEKAVDSRSRSGRDYSRTQNEYYARSRSRYNYDRTNTRTGSTVSDRSAGRTNARVSTPNVRSSRSTTDYSRPSYRSSANSRSRSGTYSNRSSGRSSYSGRSYSSPSRSSSSYSSGSRSSSSYSNRSYSSGSRSSGYSSGSRSSGSSGSRSSSGSSRGRR